MKSWTEWRLPSDVYKSVCRPMDRARHPIQLLFASIMRAEENSALDGEENLPQTIGA